MGNVFVKHGLNSVVIACFVCLLGCTQAKNAESNKSDSRETVGDAQTSAVATAVVALHNAMIKKDKQLLQDLCAEELTYGHSNGEIQNKEEFIADVIHGNFSFLSIDTPEQQIMLENNVALVRHILTAQATRSGEAVAIRIGNIQVYKRGVDGGWKLWARQAYKL